MLAVIKSHKGEETVQIEEMGLSAINKDDHNSQAAQIIVPKPQEGGEYDELRQKWSMDGLIKRFEERIEKHCTEKTKAELK